MNKIFNLKFDEKTSKLVNNFRWISFAIFIISILCLYVFRKFYISIYLYELSLFLFRIGLIINIFPTICGIFITQTTNGNIF